MRTWMIPAVCLALATACSSGGGTASDTGPGDVTDPGTHDPGMFDQGPVPDVPDPGQLDVPEDKGSPPDDLLPEPGWPDGVDDVVDVISDCTKPEDCDDGNDCTADLCKDGVCVHECLEGLACDDGNPFSFPDKCLLEPLTGQCLCYGHLECDRDTDCNDLDPCTGDWCDENGVCIHDCLTGEPCNDAVPDTIDDLCNLGTDGECGCAGMTGSCQDDGDCDDGNECTQDVCTADKKCQYGCFEGQPCDDGYPFSIEDKCLFYPFLGKCFCEGKLECINDKDCNDGDPCTDDWCNADGQCHHDCNLGFPCDDGDPGTIDDLCLSSLIEQCVCMGTPAECANDGDCNDGNLCTLDVCTEDFQCIHGCLEGLKCDDGNLFTDEDKCLFDKVTGECECLGKTECAADKECEDGSTCTLDWCDKNGACHHDCDASALCNDGDPGTIKDTCLFSPLGLCECIGTALECTQDADCDDGDDCTKDICKDGSCHHECQQGLNCDDGNPFNLGDKCLLYPLTGACFCQGQPECTGDFHCDDGNDCTKDWCDANGVCHFDCTVDEKCDDQDPATSKDVCTFLPIGECACEGVDVECADDADCDDGNDCTLDGCNQGKCWHDCLDGLDCDDENPFTFEDLCQSDPVTGQCWCGGKTECQEHADCDDGNACTLDSCDKNGTCHHDCMPDEKCDDGNPSTIKDTCMFSAVGDCVCLGIPVECVEDGDCDDGNPCTLDGCKDGKCWHDCQEGLVCDDGDPFTDKDACLFDAVTGACVCLGQKECNDDPDCDDGMACTKDWCDATGTCHHDCLPGEKCNEGDPDTINDVCDFSVTGACLCLGVVLECKEPGDCDDGNACTKDVCVDGKCVHDCLDGLKCDDGNPYTFDDKCLSDPLSLDCFCQGAPECGDDSDCNDGNPCTKDSCDKNGVCHHDCTPDTACDDGDPFTIKDLCQFSADGECLCEGVLVKCIEDADCDDGNACTLDVCADGLCLHDCQEGMGCDDANPFTAKDVCLLDPLSAACLCEGKPECTQDPDCDDGNECTEDWCDENGVCHHNCKVEMPCNDGDPMTILDQCLFDPTGACGCQGTKVDCKDDPDCDDGNECTKDVCVDGQCVQDCLDGMECDDGNPFTFLDYCWQVADTGKCVCLGEYECSGDEDCFDSNDCTTDWCDKNGFCHNDCLDGDKCDDGDPATILDQCLFGDTGECLCTGTPAECQSDKDCDDGNACSLDACIDGACFNDCLDGLKCDDGNPFTFEDSCLSFGFAGQCLCVGSPECNSDDDCFDGNDCTTDSCDKNGTCHNDCLQGEKCDDGNPMTVKDLCKNKLSGECLCEGSPGECAGDGDCEDGNDCTVDVCLAGSCVHECKNGLCEDGDPYTVNDQCILYTDPTGAEICECWGQSVECIENADCDDGNSCTADSCVKGNCVNECQDGACDDGNPFTINDQCVFLIDPLAGLPLCECVGTTKACKDNADCDDGGQNPPYCQFDEGTCEGPGVCTERPSICPLVWDPVCGCDGNTYANDCVAAMAGVSVNHKGECVSAYCYSNDMCTPEEYCYFAECALESGECKPRPELCLLVWDPVCGCDGKTYDNACLAAVAGVSVDYEGECLPDYCWSNDMCTAAEYCFFEVCALETGMCTDRPVACPDVWDPVCGCDGNTYGNDCEAAAAGISVDYTGECLPDSCWSNDMCPADHYCHMGDCGMKSGVCEPKPELCLPVWDPVCGCDGNTYGNECTAAMAGVSVDYKGECLAVYCWSNDMCALDEYCYFAVCALETGECLDRPTICPNIWLPVCGCDGQTYGNSCEAAKAGVSVDFEGECPTDKCSSNDLCAKDEYCKFTECAQETGECTTKPVLCLDIWDPVCGCDGQTYANSCAAAAAGVSVDYAGACKS